jgi:hypothetical protein
MNKRAVYFGMLIAALAAMSCESGEKEARLIIRLVDAPAEYQAVNVDILGVRVHRSEVAGEDEGGWIDLPGSDAGVVNLLDYTGGTELTLVDTWFPEGRISQVRLMLGGDNTVVIDGSSHPLETPSAQQSGLKLNVHETLLAGITYEFLLDFDAARSVVRTGNGRYLLKPVIRVITRTLSGAIRGEVLPAGENVAVYALVGTDTLGTSFAPEGKSAFMVSGLDEGSYRLVLDPGEDSEYAGLVLDDVEVMTGNVTDVGQQTLPVK